MTDLYGWLLSFFFLISLLGVIAYKLMCYADLEFDHMNPYDSAKRINFIVLPEFIIQGMLCAIYLIIGHWFFCLLSLPYAYYNIRLYRRSRHLVDVTEIYNQMPRGKKQTLYKFFYLIILLSLSLAWLIWNAQEQRY